jgi:hypothetical protein
METNEAGAAMQDSDGASDCSHFSIITPPSPPSMSSCGKCCPPDKAQQTDPDVAPLANDHKRTKDKKPLPTKSQGLQAEAPEPCIHLLAEKSEHLSSKLTEVELALEWFKIDVASKAANENNSTLKDAARAGFLDLQFESQRAAMVVVLKNQYQYLWEEVARLLHQAMFETDLRPPGPPQMIPLADQEWCLELVKNAFITSIIDGTKHGVAASMLATPTLAPDGITGLPPIDGKKKKKKKTKANNDWQPGSCVDPFSQPPPEMYGMPPTEPYPGPPEPYTRTQPMQYPPPQNPEVYGMPPANQYPGPPDPFGQVHPMPYTPIPYSPPPQSSPPPMNPEVHIVEEFPRPHDPFAGMPRLPFSRRHSIDSRSSTSVGWREKPKPRSKSRFRLRIDKLEVRWWLRTALSFSEVLCMIVVIIAVFRAPGILGELVDVMNPRNKDRCLGFRVRR